MFRSIQWRLVASYVALTLLSVALVGVLALLLVKYYITQQEIRYLTANADVIAAEASEFMRPKHDMYWLHDLAHTSAFFGNARVRIFDEKQNVLVDSGAELEMGEIFWLPPKGNDSIIVPSNVKPLFLNPASENRSSPRRPTIIPHGINQIWLSPFDLEWQQHRSETNAEEGESEGQSEGQNEDEEMIIRSARTVVVPIGYENSLLGYVELSNSPNFGVSILSTTAQAFTLAAIGTTFLATIMGLLVSRRLTAPIHKLTKATSQMSNGDLTTRAPVHTQDEIGRLAHQFNQMAVCLEHSFAELATERDTLRRFIADASHELRTPITALKTFNELLQGAAANDPVAQAEFLAESEKLLTRLEWITKNLLDISRLEAGLVELELSEYDVEELLHAAVGPFRPLAIEKQITLHIAPFPESYLIQCDRARIELTLSNLLNNALKFTALALNRIEQANITLGAAQTEERLTLWVRDSGPGISPSEQSYIFERFYRGKTNRVPGSGLGLAIAQSIVQAHGGQIRVESELDQGTCFMVDFPILG